MKHNIVLIFVALIALGSCQVEAEGHDGDHPGHGHGHGHNDPGHHHHGGDGHNHDACMTRCLQDPNAIWDWCNHHCQHPTTVEGASVGVEHHHHDRDNKKIDGEAGLEHHRDACMTHCLQNPNAIWDWCNHHCQHPTAVEDASVGVEHHHHDRDDKKVDGEAGLEHHRDACMTHCLQNPNAIWDWCNHHCQHPAAVEDASVGVEDVEIEKKASHHHCMLRCLHRGHTRAQCHHRCRTHAEDVEIEKKASHHHCMLKCLHRGHTRAQCHHRCRGHAEEEIENPLVLTPTDMGKVLSVMLGSCQESCNGEGAACTAQCATAVGNAISPLGNKLIHKPCFQTCHSRFGVEPLECMTSCAL